MPTPPDNTHHPDTHHPDWWNSFIGARPASLALIEEFLKGAQSLKPAIRGCLAVFLQEIAAAADNLFAARDAQRTDLEELLALLAGRAAVEAVMDWMVAPLDGMKAHERAWTGLEERDRVRLWLLVAQILLRAEAAEPSPEAAGIYVVRELTEVAAYLWGGAWAEREMLRRGHAQTGPSFRAWEYRLRVGYDLLPEDEIAARIDEFVKHAQGKLPQGHPLLREERSGPRQALYGQAHETILKEIPLPLGSDILLESLRRALGPGGWHNLAQKIADDIREEAEKGRPGSFYECTACGRTWRGRRKPTCQKCGARGVEPDGPIRETPTTLLPLTDDDRAG